MDNQEKKEKIASTPPSDDLETTFACSEIESLQKALQEEKERRLRVLADADNTRKRLSKEKDDLSRYCIESIITEFLTPLDNFENALGFIHQASEETRNWAQGFKMILTQFKDVLANHNVSSFESEGKEFDPHLHEALEMEESEKHKDGTITQEFVKGYKCGDKVLRPAKVKVAKSSKERQQDVKKDTENKENNNE